MIEAVLIGVLAGIVSGLVGVGGGAVIVPGLVFGLGMSQLDAEATSLLAMIPTALVGAFRQRRYGNVDLRTSAVLGTLAVAGSTIGVTIANVVSQEALKAIFGVFLLVIAAQLARRALTTPSAPPQADQL